MENTNKLAVLIDADNAQPSTVERLLIEIATQCNQHFIKLLKNILNTPLCPR